jgi:CubicO group peptidase (beta-lactamase class C family)
MMLARLGQHLAPPPVSTAGAADGSSNLAADDDPAVAAAKGRLDAATRAHAAAAHIPAVAVGVVKGGPRPVLFQAQHGTRRVETGWPVLDDSVFQIASISKTVTAVCAMQCVERGLLELDGDVSEMTSPHGGFAVRNPRYPGATVTLRMLLSHTSSVGDSSVYTDSYTAGDSQWSLSQFLHEYFSASGCFHSDDVYTEHAPGASFAYSNVGAGLVGYLVEAASGLPFDVFAERNVLQPLGMRSSSFLWSGLQAKGVDLDRVAMPYSWITTTSDSDSSSGSSSSGYHKPHGFYGCPTVSDGFLRTTVGDLSQHLLTFMNDGVHPVSGERLLSAESVAEMRKQHYPGASKEYGLFWSSGTGANAAGSNHSSEDLRIGHGGGDPGVSTSMQYSPALGCGVIIFKNGTPGAGLTQAAVQVMRETAQELEAAAWELAALLSDSDN